MGKLSYCKSNFVSAPSIVWEPLASTVIVPAPLFLIMYILPFIPDADGRFIVKVPDVASTK